MKDSTFITGFMTTLISQVKPVIVSALKTSGSMRFMYFLDDGLLRSNLVHNKYCADVSQSRTYSVNMQLNRAVTVLLVSRVIKRQRNTFYLRGYLMLWC